MRIRSIKPDFFHDDRLADLEPLARLLFAGLWCCADAEGRLEDRPKRIKADCLPYDDCNVEPLLEALDRGGFITRYEASGTAVLQVVNFLKHQRLSGKEASVKSDLPPPPRDSKKPRSIGEASGKQSGSIGEAVNVLEGKGREGKGKDLPASADALRVHDEDKGQDEDEDKDQPTKRPPDSRHAEAIALFVRLWAELRGGSYVVQGAKDGSAVSRLLKVTEATEVEIARRMRFAFGDPWFAQHGDLATFCSKWSTWTPSAATVRQKPVPGALPVPSPDPERPCEICGEATIRIFWGHPCCSACQDPLAQRLRGSGGLTKARVDRAFAEIPRGAA